MTEGLRSVLLGTSALSVALVVAFVLTISRPIPPGDSPARERMLRLFLLGVAAQCLHFTEEFVTGFYVRFPRLLGLPAWTPSFFVAFNLAWITIWILSAVAFREGARAALFPIWFFAIGMTMNGIAHPVLALLAGGYFPGLVTSPVAGVVGVVLWVRLLAFTRQ